MDSITSLPVADVHKLFAGDAVYSIEDPVIGERVQEMKRNGFPIESMVGLDFCKQNVLDDKRVRHVLEALFPRSGLGIYEVYRTEPNHFYAFMTGLDPELKGVAVGLCSPDFSMVLKAGSNLLHVGGWWASNGLLEMPHGALKGCKPIDIVLEKGGLLICDARLSWKRLKGYVIFFVFATEEELARWPAKKYPRGGDFEQKITQMQSPTIGVKFTC